MDSINDFIIGESGALWLYPLLFAVCIIDGFFPPIPSETVLVTLGSLGGATGEPYLWAVIPVAALGAVIGDNIAYTIGKFVGTDRWAWMRKPKTAAAFAWARHALDERGPVIIVTARFIPVGRIAVNITAGATGYPRRVFFPLTVVAGLIWASYSALMGHFVGGWFESQPLLGAVISICIAVVVGLIVDKLMQRFQARKRAAAGSNAAAKSEEPTS
ncbi:DedA family protein [Tomitella fengzijianii]|uniref:DedA family protein n=1 Tax=Tomitella fengzijianii TaxID=2597660 RepID=A0A516X7K2_9ACTN|nr:DedA family protein [Tomitella fengzijianii]